MKYLGGKTMIRRWVRRVILSRVANPHAARYVEPFVGSAAIWTEMAWMFGSAHGSDAHADLVALLNAVRDGWEPPEMTKELYESLRVSLEPSALRGYAGFMCSFGGMFFRGYFGGYEDGDERLRQNERVIADLRQNLAMCPPVFLLDFAGVPVGSGDVVYCDPPYNGTEDYSVGFDSYRFWATAARWVRDGATVLVSESSAPANWCSVAQRKRASLLSYRANGEGRFTVSRTERIYMHESQADAHSRMKHQDAARRGERSWPAIE